MNLFPLWVLLGCCSGLFFPSLYVSWYKPIYVTTMLAITMLCMGFTLSVDDITQVLKNPYRVGVGAVLQYTIMPTLGFLLSKLPSMPTHFAAGIILVSCCPGGTASNIISYLARADVGLSVMMTTARCAHAAAHPLRGVHGRLRVHCQSVLHRLSEGSRALATELACCLCSVCRPVRVAHNTTRLCAAPWRLWS